MKRLPRVRMLLVFLLLGAVINVVVSLGLGLWMRPLKEQWNPGLTPSLDDCHRWTEYRLGPFTEKPLVKTLWKAAGVDAVVLDSDRTGYSKLTDDGAGVFGGVDTVTNRPSVWDRVIYARAGFPCRSLGCVWIQPKGISWTSDEPLRDARVSFASLLWPGFAINTLFYSGVCWLLVAAPFALRRRRRVKRGLCPACAYPVGTSEVCTECGTPKPVTVARSR